MIGPSTTNKMLAHVLAQAWNNASRRRPLTQRQIDAIDEAQQRVAETPDEE